MSPWRVGVVIPAHDEEDSIGGCVESVLVALERAAVESWVVVVADACRDRTAVRAREALGAHGEVVHSSARCVGVARRMGSERVLSRLPRGNRQRQWLLNTDADTRVPPEWVTTHLGMADQGVLAIAGIVAVDSFEGHGPGAAEIFAAAYELRPDQSHPHVHGANLGIRADAYDSIGGWRDLQVSEDHCLWNRVRRAGGRTLSPTRSVVTTSGRPFGRAAGGFADTLRRLCAAGELKPIARPAIS